MNDVLIIDKDHSISSVEQGLQALRGDGPIVDLLLNTSVRHAQFGGLTALNQLVVTWGKRFPSATLRTYVVDPADAVTQIENLAKYDHGLTALLMANRVSDRAGLANFASQAAAATRPRLKAMDTIRGATRGAKAFLAVADHTGIVPGTLYDEHAIDDPEVRQLDGFRSIATQLLAVVTAGPEARKPTAPVAARFATVLFELFKNTHDWARHGVKWDVVARSVRGIRVEHYSHPHETHLDMTADELPLHRYVSHPKMKRDGGRSRFIEVSVLDSGPGLAARTLQERSALAGESANSIGHEHAAVIDCLKTHFSTSSESHRGNGLHQVFVMLNALHGFVRVRTGRLALWRDFVETPYVPSDAGEPFLLDWSTGSLVATDAPSVEGTAMTMMFPVAYD